MEFPSRPEDTSAEAWERVIEWNRNASFDEKFNLVFEWTEFLIKASEAGVRADYPGASEREVFLRAAARRLGNDLVKKAYSWDPESNDPVPERP
jgi:hypothetical protein